MLCGWEGNHRPGRKYGNSKPISGDPGAPIQPCPLSGLSVRLPQLAKNFAWADGHWAIFSTYQDIHSCRIAKYVVTRCVFRSENGKKCVGGCSCH